MEITGKIQWLPDRPSEYPKGSGKFNIGIKLNGEFYNLYDEQEKLAGLLTRIKVGYEVKLKVDGQAIEDIEVLSDVVEKAQSKTFTDDMISLEDLLNAAHDKSKVMNIETQIIEVNHEKKFAVFKAIVTTAHGKFEAHGDADTENVGTLVAKHWLRMAETRAIVRALRWATNNAQVAAEECENIPDLTEEQMQEELNDHLQN